MSEFTASTRAEDGNLWFEWSRSLENPAVYVLEEGFRDGEAGSVHVNSGHFKKALEDMPQALASTPQIISQTIDATGWSEMGRNDHQPSSQAATLCSGARGRNLEHSSAR